MIIRTEQMEAMRAQLFRSICDRLSERLLLDPDIRDVDPLLVRQGVAETTQDAAVLGITRSEDVYRLLRFRFLAAPVLASPLIQSVVLRVLHNLAWSVDKRLTFLEREVLPRLQSGESRREDGVLRKFPFGPECDD